MEGENYWNLSEQDQILHFLKFFRPLECSCCDNVLAFQHKETGALYCAMPSDGSGNSKNACYKTAGSLLHQMKPANGARNSPTGKNDGGIPKNSQMRPPRNVSFLNTSNDQIPSNTEAGGNIAAGGLGEGEDVSALAPKKFTTPTPLPPPTKQSEPVLKSILAPQQRAAPEVKAVPRPKTEREVPKAHAAPEGEVHTWSKCRYSKNLNNKAQVYVQHQYSPIQYHINAAADTKALAKFQEELLLDYVANAKPLTQVPIPDQMVIGNYSGQSYRGRVEKVEGDNCMILFVDYGDRSLCKFSELFPVDDTIMEHPIYGMMVQLHKVQNPPANFKLNEELEAVLGEILTLDIPRGVTLIPEEGSYIIQVRLWDATDQDSLLNETFTTAIKASAR